jgi:hypothetical protein
LAVLAENSLAQTSLSLIVAGPRNPRAYEAVKVARTRLTKAEVGSHLRLIAATIRHVTDDC